MASILDVVKGLSQAAANAYDGYDNMDEKIGLSEVLMKEVHPRGQFENEIERKFGDIVKYLKKEYRKVMKSSVTLSEVSDADIYVQSTSRVRNFVQATKHYKIGGVEGVEPLKKPSKESAEDGIKKFLDLFSDKRPSNDKASKNPDTPEA